MWLRRGAECRSRGGVSVHSTGCPGWPLGQAWGGARSGRRPGVRLWVRQALGTVTGTQGKLSSVLRGCLACDGGHTPRAKQAGVFGKLGFASQQPGQQLRSVGSLTSASSWHCWSCSLHTCGLAPGLATMPSANSCIPWGLSAFLSLCWPEPILSGGEQGRQLDVPWPPAGTTSLPTHDCKGTRLSSWVTLLP